MSRVRFCCRCGAALWAKVDDRRRARHLWPDVPARLAEALDGMILSCKCGSSWQLKAHDKGVCLGRRDDGQGSGHQRRRA
jgi:hypothetical protein